MNEATNVFVELLTSCKTCLANGQTKGNVWIVRISGKTEANGELQGDRQSKERCCPWPHGYVSRWRPEGSTRPIKGRKVSWELLMYFGDTLRQTEKGLKNTNSGQSRDSLKTQRLSSLCSYLWRWVGFHSWFLFFPSSLKNVMNSISFLTGPAWQKQPTLPIARTLLRTGLSRWVPEAHQGYPAALQRLCHSTQFSRLGIISQQSPQVLQSIRRKALFLPFRAGGW